MALRTSAAVVVLGAVLIALGAAPGARAQEPFARRPASVLDAVPPSAHVRGAPGRMLVQPQPCRTLPISAARRRIVDLAVQEWGFFGFGVVDRTVLEQDDGGDNGGPGERRGPRRVSRLGAAEAARVAPSIAGYWAVTPEGSWIVARQNDAWNGPVGMAARWNAPWSAAFISWVMCEAGLGTNGQFRRAIAHHAYIDQAIRARDGRAPESAFVAHDAGETEIVPGDLLCSSRRPAYRTIADRRRQVGIGARSHCDIVVAVDDAAGRVYTIGGNVQEAVTLKVFAAVRGGGGPLRLLHSGEADEPMFAHLKLRAGRIEPDAILSSPTVRALECSAGTVFPFIARGTPNSFSDLPNSSC